MSFWEKCFGWEVGGDNYSHKFSIWHFVVLALIIGASVAICLVAKKKDKAWQDKMFKIIAWVLLALEIVRMIYRTISCVCYNKYLPAERNPYDWAEIISFALCSMITYFTIVTLLINKQKWNDFAYDAIFVIALLGGGAALIYPDMLNTHYPIYHITSVQTLITHGIIVCLPFLLLATGRIKLNIKNCWKPLVVMVVFAAIARIMSVATDNNFMYMDGFDILPAFDGVSFWVYIWLLIPAFALYTFICYLPSLIKGAVVKHKQAKAESAKTDN